ncbi:hypothetical protein GCM10027030_20810 [Luteococcus sediminum]|uniref:hypothetical protein n=1 Tax=Luteococcus sp. TaxID=1969402 RepID=UPI0037361229
MLTSEIDERPGTTGGAVRADDGSGRGGRWAVVVSALALATTALASGVLFNGFLRLARLPGPTPALDRVPPGPEADQAVGLMQAGAWLFVPAGLLMLVGLVGGVRLARRPDSFASGVWAIALAAGCPVLAVMLLTGMGAT